MLPPASPTSINRARRAMQFANAESTFCDYDESPGMGADSAIELPNNRLRHIPQRGTTKADDHHDQYLDPDAFRITSAGGRKR